MVIFENVSKAYSGSTSEALSNLDIRMPKGKFTVLIGPSGCGKTTTLKMINRLVEPTSGRILVDGQDTSTVDAVDLRRGIGYVIQQVGLFPNMTIGENIQVVPKLLKWPKDKRVSRAKELLDMVGMDPGEYMGRYPSQLSGGQQQRIGVLRALAVSPPLLLMDEPFGALDPITRESLQDEMKRLQADLGITVVFVTHDIDEAVKLADEIVLMKDGKIVQKDSPSELLSHPANDYVREFVGKKRLRANYDVGSVLEVMNSRVVTASKDQSVSSALNTMRRHNVDSLVIVRPSGALEGVVTIESLRASLGVAGVRSISDVGVAPLASVREDAQARDAFDKLINEKLPFIVVQDSADRVIGMVNKTSLVKSLAGVVWGEDDNADAS